LTYSDEWQEAQLFELKKLNASFLIMRLILTGRIEEARKAAEQEKTGTGTKT
jgi:hypothetical protein